MITASVFAQQNGFSKRDLWTVEKMYKDQLKTSEEWSELLRKSFSFNQIVSNSIEEVGSKNDDNKSSKKK